MGKRTIMLIGVILLGVIIGVSTANRQAKDPLLKEMLKQQESILAAQQRMEGKMFGDTGPVFLDGKGDPVSSASAPANNIQIQALEARIASLEDQLTGLTKSWTLF